jgi:hypothetical protein
MAETNLEIRDYYRKRFPVKVVEVTPDNMQDVAQWCNGKIKEKQILGGKGTMKFIKVDVFRPLNTRQSEAYVGDFVLYHRNGYKVYTPNAFHESFELAEDADSSVVQETV